MTKPLHEIAEIAVIGAGGAGMMAYLRAILNCNQAVLFQGNAETRRKGRATWVAEVDNIPGMHGMKNPITTTARGTLKWIESQPQLAACGTVINGMVTRIVPQDSVFCLHYELKGIEHTLLARYVVLATGVMDIQPEIGGSILPILPFANQGHVLYCIRCDGHRTLGKQLSVISHQEKGVYIAAMMHERYGHEQIKLFTHGAEPIFSEEAWRIVKAYGMEVYSEVIHAILGDPKTGLEGFVLADGTSVATTCALVALGSLVYNRLLADLGAELESDGRIHTSAKFESSVSGIFAVGDLVAGTKMQLYTAWEEAVIAIEEIDSRLRREKRLAKLKGS
ncbi:NAD(P)/FAD-dependent oxidoreductase [bacterium (Candidatus Blackallbacteria) CG17_big_fil_post_rev_8_21_14_2_50_48_46]|uniref:NAD(P)/FAD-dependent oxidoreductase n=1 Tax=bacterium (Candidatus Blackallbacteria) CG17_big_fil_post_rev_8_21_14_2_50_48_46 TaxID=2014261 RepID=A0A2M7G521_9BACT|nr:MAG: thioredoxin [bacterium (Candidatus Blackallbacteria) CG18_big_fil_WC_8_21_14_2_50_49_26]PIW17046.1 MAG: NAD(P)/FAD-dependent oxidoreductase [bacterium (Candidatus Blackallbacteria) CG17_big_fil_post_rev_8_21_14_2_50_48_46]PIW47719.1 MAG: NAD(P)/FAD-dependent oxidoreductase [bacterium (Candidatus Blackallbacteria) CG13_big_fil_rev_8_21_14_2_50_49_14]